VNARTFADATMDDPVSAALLWGSFGLVALALLVGIVAVILRGNPEQPDRTEPETPRKCDTTGCSFRGWVPVTRRDDSTSAKVCHGCYDLGLIEGRWVA